jgi:dGTPase
VLPRSQSLLSKPARRLERLHDKKPRTVGDLRTPAQRDRDRILYSSSFRRLAEVTQVVSANNGYVFHNRLTHSLQVAQVGRRLAEMLVKQEPQLATDLLCPDVVEAACLAHDLGHPPFGHVAEHRLNELCASVGGFEGNAQSFRIVTRLASRSSSYGGLDLTAATLAAMLKYPWMRTKRAKKWGAYHSEEEAFKFASRLLPAKGSPTIEAQLMDWADDVTYSVHDLEDFYRAGRLPLHLLAQPNSQECESFFRNVFQRRQSDDAFKNRDGLIDAFRAVLVPFSIPGPYDGSSQHRGKLRQFSGFLIGRYLNAARLERQEKTTQLLIDPDLKEEVRMLKELTWTYVIEAPSLAARQQGQSRVIEDLFDVYTELAECSKDRKAFPPFYRERLEASSGKRERIRACVDLIAGMTESQAITMHQRLSGNSHSSGLDDVLN